MHPTYNHLAKILRTKPESLADFAQTMERLTGKRGVIEKLMEENTALVDRTLGELGLSRASTAGEVSRALMERVMQLDNQLVSNIAGKPLEAAVKLVQPSPGFFIKHERAVTMLEKFPPQNLLDHFGYKTVAELVEKQGFASVFASLRFAQDEVWMHTFFDKGYADLTADDFEERDVELKMLEPEWLAVAEKFLKKKYHNVSHLKELGIIFVVPNNSELPGETTRMFTLLLHYLNEVPFYTKLIKEYSEKGDFVKKLQSLLRGDVPEGQAPAGSFRIVQRYLAKDDEHDFRLFEPHVNPEAEHWYKAEGNLQKLGGEFAVWQELDFVGDMWGDELVSFDLIDLVMSLVKKGEIKYLYHQQEALWNKLFIEYLGRDRVNEEIEKNIIDGFIKL